MRVADLYIAMCLVGACVAIGWSAREYHDRQQKQMKMLELRVNVLTRATRAALPDASKDDFLTAMRIREVEHAAT